MSPTSLPLEIGNALSAMFKRQRVTLQQARRVLDVYQAIPVRLVPVDLQRAVTLASDLGIYAYDALRARLRPFRTGPAALAG